MQNLSGSRPVSYIELYIYIILFGINKEFLLYKLECLMDISTTEKNRINSSEKLPQFFACG